MKRNYITKKISERRQRADARHSALAKYKDIIDLSIGDTDFITDEGIIKAPPSMTRRPGIRATATPKGDQAYRRGVCRACRI